MLIEYFNERRQKSNYEMDGIVVMDNNRAYDVVEGNPKYGFAFKTITKDQFTIAEVIDVEWDVSRYNYLKPRIRIKPVQLVGVTITYATAHNAKFIYDNKIGEGSKIKIVRSGDVIPKIMEVLTPATDGKPKMPDIPYVWNETEVDILIKRQTKESSSIITIKQIVNTMKTLDVKYIDEGLVKKLVDEGYDSFIKILKADKEKISDIIGSKMTDKIYANLENALKNTQLHILMASSNKFGRGIGIKKLHVITKMYPNIMIKKWTTSELKNKIEKLEGFQEKTTNKFVEGFPKFQKFFEKINKYVNIEYLREPDLKETGNLFTNKKVVMTGFRSNEISDFIEKNGGTITGSVSKNTSLVVCLDKSESSTKLTTAKKLGISIITKEEFEERYKL